MEQELVRVELSDSKGKERLDTSTGRPWTFAKVIVRGSGRPVFESRVKTPSMTVLESRRFRHPEDAIRWAKSWGLPISCTSPGVHKIAQGMYPEAVSAFIDTDRSHRQADAMRAAFPTTAREAYDAISALDYSALPEHLRDSLRAFCELHRPVGGFLTAVLENDLAGAVGRADGTNLPLLHEIVQWVYNVPPSGCWGSREKVKAWLKEVE